MERSEAPNYNAGDALPSRVSFDASKLCTGGPVSKIRVGTVLLGLADVRCPKPDQTGAQKAFHPLCPAPVDHVRETSLVKKLGTLESPLPIELLQTSVGQRIRRSQGELRRSTGVFGSTNLQRICHPH